LGAGVGTEEDDGCGGGGGGGGGGTELVGWADDDSFGGGTETTGWTDDDSFGRGLGLEPAFCEVVDVDSVALDGGGTTIGGGIELDDECVDEADELEECDGDGEGEELGVGLGLGDFVVRKVDDEVLWISLDNEVIGVLELCHCRSASVSVYSFLFFFFFTFLDHVIRRILSLPTIRTSPSKVKENTV
jgi:hypothetical protein